VQADRKIVYAYYGNNAADLDPLPVGHTRLTVVEPALFELDVFKMATPIQSPAKCVPSYDFSTQKVNVGYNGLSAVQSGPRTQ